MSLTTMIASCSRAISAFLLLLWVMWFIVTASTIHERRRFSESICLTFLAHFIITSRMSSILVECLLPLPRVIHNLELCQNLPSCHIRCISQLVSLSALLKLDVRVQTHLQSDMFSKVRCDILLMSIVVVNEANIIRMLATCKISLYLLYNEREYLDFIDSFR